MQMAQGDFAGARASFEEAVAICRRLVAADTTDVQAQRDMSLALAKLGDAQRVQRNYADARASYAESLLVVRGLLERFPSNEQYRRDVAYSEGLVAYAERLLASGGGVQ